ncbi:ABC transporter ATP-binding protein [Streptomyces sp. MBT56]|uniref:ABC transporter ATP-binding protein n=1 Tax=unclassified Streptomyces TaxID=2593676 RepID=UPI00190B05C0|nr:MULTISPECIES: ABC transporter ATP-binding protein [unclassified Streptomyces]MBK3556138.1 ABC transporter ATP-binding protein [Streptomyces sp. MBT56]MBK3603539.1 ABC transporter ATP-binding protein [Streptomyces sp. MBT54]MBK3616873.1 ABC transporter ATP-binding protein [Streptomyces sp. MBT98]MBK6041015.1 ABC transporter ATP-binding protein [Streptomyces sp. MBT55]
MTVTDTPVAPTTLRTATGGEAARWVARHCRQAPWLSASTVLTTVAGAALQVLPVLLLGQVVDGVVGGESRSILLTVGILMVAAALFGAAATAASTFLIGKLGAELLARLREEAVRAVLGMPSARVEEVGRGDVLSRVGDDVAVISKGIRTAIPTVFSAGVLVVIATIGMFGLDWRLGLAGACALPAYALALRWYLPRSAPLYRKQRVAQARRAQALISGLNGIDTVRAYRLEDAVREKVTDESWRVRNLGIEVFRFFGRFVGRENRAEFIGLVLILVVGYALLEADAATLGEVSAAPLMFHRLFTPLGAIMFTFDEAQKSGASLTRLVGVFSEPSEERLVGDASVVAAAVAPYPVTVRDLTFTYPGAEDPVLRDVSLSIPAGGSLALVGATGAGKSTLAALIAGIGRPQAGSVHIGTHDLAGTDEAGARALVSILTQETHVFSGPLSDDLRLAAPLASDGDLMDALRTVGAGEWAGSLPDGLNTPVGEGGERLDVTKVAQLALARLVLGRSPVVVLDESTAEAGSEGAAELERAVLAACSGRTTLFVAHRLTQAMAADRIAVLSAGRVVEEGTHSELVELGGQYARLWRAWREGS